MRFFFLIQTFEKRRILLVRSIWHQFREYFTGPSPLVFHVWGVFFPSHKCMCTPKIRRCFCKHSIHTKSLHQNRPFHAIFPERQYRKLLHFVLSNFCHSSVFANFAAFTSQKACKFSIRFTVVLREKPHNRMQLPVELRGFCLARQYTYVAEPWQYNALLSLQKCLLFRALPGCEALPSAHSVIRIKMKKSSPVNCLSGKI